MKHKTIIEEIAMADLSDRIYDTKEQFLKQYLRDEKLSQLGI